MTSNFVIVSYFTEQYAYEKTRLVSSLEKLRLSHIVKEIKSRGSWIANVNYKPTFCSDMLAELDMPIVWVDSDAEIIKYPALFDMMRRSCDIGVYHRNRPYAEYELLSGTVYFNNTWRAKEILEKWKSLSARSPNEWDQRTLQQAIETYNGELKLFELPASYVRIFDAKDMADVDPVILHHQASRKLKKVINA